jgi:hypothetical protein
MIYLANNLYLYINNNYLIKWQPEQHRQDTQEALAMLYVRSSSPSITHQFMFAGKAVTIALAEQMIQKEGLTLKLHIKRRSRTHVQKIHSGVNVDQKRRVR